MNYDNGEVLPGLNEQWTFMGANAMEWCVGLVVFVMIGSFARTPASAMPFMLGGWVLTTTTLATIRNMFPDQERGVRNAVMTACGFVPPGIPAPSALQPVWSGAPVKELKKEIKFVKLGLNNLFPSFREELLEADEM
jgi:hypothetical protein